MASAYQQRKSRWYRFDQLFDLPEIKRDKFYNQESLVFLLKFVSMEMHGYALPDIDNTEDFFEIIQVLRLNYRQWNQRLSALLWAYSELKDAASRQELADFIKSCPWNMLVDVACDTVEQV